LNPQMDLGTGLFSTSKSVTDWPKHASYGSSRELVKAKAGSVSSLSVSLFPNVYSQNFSLGVLARIQRSSYYNSKDLTWNFYSRWLVVPSMGISMALGGGRIRLGAAVRAIQITETKGVNPDTNSTQPLQESTGEGLGIGLDAGMLITMPWGGLPTLGLVARNVGDTSFPTRGFIKHGGGNKVNKEKISGTYDAGFAISPKLGQRDTLTIAADYRDLLNKTGANDLRHANFGMEFKIGKKLFFRAGFSQGYWTAGIGLATKEGAFDLGSYADELHATKYNQVEDRKLSMRFTRRF
jgi:hypothetical protein